MFTALAIALTASEVITAAEAVTAVATATAAVVTVVSMCKSDNE